VFGRKENKKKLTDKCIIGTVRENYWATDRSRDGGSGTDARLMKELTKNENLR
jgi:hypothetical protein